MTGLQYTIMMLTGVFYGFLFTKLLGYLDLSWWWVTCPLWGGALFIMTVGTLKARWKK